jgi:hypothetical protein
LRQLLGLIRLDRQKRPGICNTLKANNLTKRHIKIAGQTTWKEWTEAAYPNWLSNNNFGHEWMLEDRGKDGKIKYTRFKGTSPKAYPLIMFTKKKRNYDINSPNDIWERHTSSFQFRHCHHYHRLVRPFRSQPGRDFEKKRANTQ